MSLLCGLSGRLTNHISVQCMLKNSDENCWYHGSKRGKVKEGKLNRKNVSIFAQLHYNNITI
jgi:hypothetical protein